MPRIDRLHLAGLHPAADHFGFLRYPILQLVLQEIADPRRAVDQLVGEDPGGERMPAGEIDLGRDVVGEGGGRIGLGADLVRGAEPQVKDAAEDPLVSSSLVLQ
jgi:hypothetical protein